MGKYSHKYNIILDNMNMSEYRIRPISTITYIQDSFARYCATKKVAAFDLFSKNLIWVVGEFNIEFEGNPPFWSEEICVNIWMSEITKLKFFVDYEITYKDKPFAKGNSCWFLLDSDTKRPVKTDVIADKFKICNELAIGEHKKFILPPTENCISEITHKTNLSDIDFNRHVNNKSYINLAEATATEEFKKTHSLKTLRIRFNRESFLNDILTCSTCKTPVSDTYVHKITKDGKSVCDIQTIWTDKIQTAENITEYPLAVKSE